MPTSTVLSIDLTEETPTERTVTVADMPDFAAELAAYHASFAPLFRRSEQRTWADAYLRGLLTADVPRKNIEAIALRLFGAGDAAARPVRALQQFVGEGGLGRCGDPDRAPRPGRRDARGRRQGADHRWE